MTSSRFDSRTGGIALVVGYSVLIVALFRNPADGLATATATVQGGVFFLALPVLGVLSGVYTTVGGPFRTAVAFLGASYLGVVGVALTLVPTENQVATTGLGLLLMAVSAFAVLANVWTSLSGVMPDQFARE
jgi:hypothetical protein